VGGKNDPKVDAATKREDKKKHPNIDDAAIPKKMHNSARFRKKVC